MQRRRCHKSDVHRRRCHRSDVYRRTVHISDMFRRTCHRCDVHQRRCHMCDLPQRWRRPRRRTCLCRRSCPSSTLLRPKVLPRPSARVPLTGRRLMAHHPRRSTPPTAFLCRQHFPNAVVRPDLCSEEAGRYPSARAWTPVHRRLRDLYLRRTQLYAASRFRRSFRSARVHCQRTASRYKRLAPHRHCLQRMACRRRRLTPVICAPLETCLGRRPPLTALSTMRRRT